MRASYLADLDVREYYSLSGDSVHHLVNVIRLEVGEELLLLSGKGLTVRTVVEQVSKKSIGLKFLNSHVHDRRFNLDLALGMPKRDALELTIKEAVELGFRRLYLIRSHHGQQKFLEPERIHNLLVSALEQSNAPFITEVIESKWDDVIWESYGEVLLLDSQTKGLVQKARISTDDRLLVVGPEGGFSKQEISFLHQRENVRVLCLPTPILRTPTAVAAGAGVILQTLLD